MIRRVSRVASLLAATSVGLGSFVTGRAWAQTLSNIVETGQTAPGGGTFTSIGDPVYTSSNGTVAFIAGTTNGYSGIFTASSTGTLSLVARSTDTAPTLGQAYGTFSRVVVNNNGTVAFFAGQNLFEDVAGATSYITTTGRYQTSLTIDDSGELAYRATNSGLQSVVTVTSGTLNTVEQRGGAAPGGSTFAASSGQSTVSLNASGTVLFQNALTNGTNGLFEANSSGTLSEILSQGTTTPDGDTFALFAEYNAINNNGLVAFSATTNAHSVADYLYNNGVVTDIVPLTSAGSTGTVLSSLSTPVSLSSTGEVAFTGFINSSTFQTIYGRDSSGHYYQFSSAGQSFLSSTLVSDDVLNNGLADDGTVVLNYTLANGSSGIARSTGAQIAGLSFSPAAVAPEPAALALFVWVGVPVASAIVKRRT